MFQCMNIFSARVPYLSSISADSRKVDWIQFQKMDRCNSFQRELTKNSRYKIMKQVGDGGNGTVVMAVDTETNKHVAIKFLEFQHLFYNPRMVNGSVKRLQREIIHHKLLSGHPNIIEFYEVFLTKQYMCIVMEYANGSDLFELVQHCRNTGTSLSEDDARHFFQQLIFAVDWCHKQSVVNRDIKLENTLLQQQPDTSWTVKLCDFGYSKHLLLNSKPRSCVGSIQYMSPEVLHADENPHTEYDAQKAEVWSCGVVLYILLFGQYPFDPCLPQNEFFEIVKSTIYGFNENVCVSEEAKDLISFLLIQEDMRYSLEEIMNHKWFKVNLPPMPAPLPRRSQQTDEQIMELVVQAKNMGCKEKENSIRQDNITFIIQQSKRDHTSSKQLRKLPVTEDC
eukprot:TRINITY_DN4295_c0_g2_i1.p1 TRINITY_DN4295_c0_g2~~TRINITY_DN4295_c0_g2_i1.p1  ORF type:complete len:395 (+),score=44.98 TRINITY_DN4295_c0_g2_i1:49-1233(+)